MTMQARTVTVLKSWRFAHSDKPEQAQVTFDDRKWESVCVPHDWAIAGPFDKEIDKQVVAIVQNGEKEATEKTGRSGALPWIGCGWYRTHVSINPATERAILNFDGAMAEPVVYVNGQKAGEWKYGYSAFNIDITPYINRSGSDNVIAVRLQNVEESSRWYPGAGLYRPVKLITTGETALEQWGVTAVTTAIINKKKNGDANVAELLTASVNQKKGQRLRVIFTVIDPSDDRILVSKRNHVSKGIATVSMNINHVQLWSPETPKLYTLRTSLVDMADSTKVIDETEQHIGFRTVSCSAEGGFQLNGVTRKIKGVCLHHDLGMIGAAVNKAALRRQLMLLKTMGCDAIRTSHNMPSQMQMDLCDSLGMMVMAESFDMWVYPKCKNGYARFFNEWSDRDIENLVRANRNHPSIVMWSVGNEIPEQGMKDGPRLLRHLQEVVRRYDTTRPITNGMDRIDNALKTGFAQVADCPGMNYRTHKYAMALENLGHGYVLGSETASTVSSRGVYKFPVQRQDNHAYEDGQCSSYDVEACWWSNIPEEDWLLQDDDDRVIGEFVWTGFDYLGEPTPYDEYWPSRSSYFGIFDLAGLPKDRYYLYRSRWNKDVETLHLLPHWTWTGREGEVTPVYCYTNYPSAELFVNGVSQGRISKVGRRKAIKASGKDGHITDINDPVIDRYRLRWNNVKYEPGELKVVAYDKSGNAVAEQVVRTAGKPAAVRLSGDALLAADDAVLRADGEDMAFITATVVDAEGNVCPDADQQLSVTVKGAAEFKGICNGDATSLEPFVRPAMKAFHGQLVIGVQSKDKSGTAVVTVKAPGLKPATYTLRVE